MSNIWSVRGVSPDLRRDIVEAATRSGVTVAEWLDRTVSPALRAPQPRVEARFDDGMGPRATPDLQEDRLKDPVKEIVSAIDACLDCLDALTATSHDQPLAPVPPT